jgi:hypothetical protein
LEGKQQQNKDEERNLTAPGEQWHKEQRLWGFQSRSQKKHKIVAWFGSLGAFYGRTWCIDRHVFESTVDDSYHISNDNTEKRHSAT